jgi:mannose-6-phosphate isomerase-like protein (cupin superfamily)
VSNRRVFQFDQVDPVPRALPNGERMLRRPYIEHGAPLAAGSALAASGVNRLEPGSALPWHEHRDDEEAHVFISGRGFYIDKDRVRHPVKAGDIAFCLKGEGHGVENPGPEPLLWGAVIVGSSG